MWFIWCKYKYSGVKVSKDNIYFIVCHYIHLVYFVSYINIFAGEMRLSGCWSVCHLFQHLLPVLLVIFALILFQCFEQVVCIICRVHTVLNRWGNVSTLYELTVISSCCYVLLYLIQCTTRNLKNKPFNVFFSATLFLSPGNILQTLSFISKKYYHQIKIHAVSLLINNGKQSKGGGLGGFLAPGQIIPSPFCFYFKHV